MDSILIFTLSLLENLLIYVMLIIFDPHNKLKLYKLALLCLATTGSTVILDFFNIPCQTVISIFLYLVLMHLFNRSLVRNLLSDMLIVTDMIILYELLLNVAIGRIPCLSVDFRTLAFILVLTIAVLVLLRNNRHINWLMEKYYRPNRMIVLWTIIGITVFCMVISQLWDDNRKFFWSEYSMILMLVILYLILNFFFFAYIYRTHRKEAELHMMKQYGDYLRRAADEAGHREHEFKNHINAIIAIMEKVPEDASRDMAIRYAEQVLETQKRTLPQSLLSNNLVMGAFLYRQKEFAEKQKINFSYLYPKEFPKYPLSDQEMVEVLSNLINNAFEAVGRLPEQRRNVFLEFSPGKIEIKNDIQTTEDGPVRIDISSGGEGHGYGLDNIRRTIKRKSGKLDLYMTKTQILFRITF